MIICNTTEYADARAAHPKAFILVDDGPHDSGVIYPPQSPPFPVSPARVQRARASKRAKRFTPKE